MKCSPVPPTRTSGWWSGCSPSLPSSSRPGCGTRASGWPTGSPSCTSGPSTVMMTYWAAPRPSRSSRRSSASGRPASRWRAGRASSEATAPHRGSPPGLLGGCVSGFDATLMPVPILVPTTSDGGEGCTSVTTAGPTRSARTCTSDPDHRTQVDLGRSYPVVGWASKISAWWLWWDAVWGWPVTTSPVDQFAVAPDPGVARTVDELIERLRSLKVWAGDPSYEAITDRINAAWAAAGRPPGELARRGTVVDCFKLGRRRLNTDLVAAVVRALNPDEGYVAQWRQALRVALGEISAAVQVRAQDRLPDDVAEFTGRSRELDRLRDALRRRAEAGGAVVISAIEGMAGVGKTQLAVHAGHVLAAERRFDQVLFVNLRGFHPDPTQPPADPAAVLDSFLRLLGVPGQAIPHDLPARTTLYRRRLTGTRALVILDNAADDRDALIRVARRCGHLPLALSLVAAQMRGRPGWTVTDHADRLDERHRQRRLDAGIELALTLSYQQLPDDRRRLVRLLALHPGPHFDPFAAAALAGIDADAAASHLRRLHADHLLQQPAPDLYTAATAMDTLYPAERHRRPRVPRPAVPGPAVADPGAARAWLDTERTNLVAAAVHAATHGWPDHTTRLAATLFRYLDTGGHYAEV